MEIYSAAFIKKNVPDVIKPKALSVQAAASPQLYLPPAVGVELHAVWEVEVKFEAVDQFAVIPISDIFQFAGKAVPVTIALGYE